MNSRTIILFLSIALSLNSFSQQLNIAKLDSLFNALSSRNLAMGSVAISRNGIIQYQHTLGFAYMEADKKIPIDIKTKFRIGSISKLFTACIIFQLVEEGKITLDQKLSAYYPTLPNAKKISITDMLYHRTGLHDYTKDTNFPDWMDKPRTHQELIKIIADKGSDFEPGSKADYCSSNYLLLGYIIEKITKKPYREGVSKRIITRIGLKNTYYGKGIDINKNESTSYKFNEGSWKKEKATDMSIHGGAGSLVSTPTDVVQFIDALFDFKIVKKSSLDKMTTLIDYYGMGLFPDLYGSKPSFGHNGRIEEFYSAVWHFPSEKLSFSYCTNGIDFPRSDIIEDLLKVCFNESLEIPFSDSSDLKMENLDKLVGHYSSKQMPLKVTCKIENGKLLLDVNGKIIELVRVRTNYFMNVQMGYFFEFFPDKGKLQVKETDNSYYFERDK